MENQQEKRRTKIWAHRGASAYAPENTLEAFQLAIDMGADGVELDVQFSKDKQLVVIHDSNLERVSNVSGTVQSYTLEELKAFRFNNKRADYAWAQIATLEEVYQLIKPTNLTINVELKTSRNQNSGIEAAIAKLTKDMGIASRVLFSSFNHNSIVRLKELIPDAKFAFLQSEELVNAAMYAKNCGVEALHPDKFFVWDDEYLRQCRELRIEVHPFTVDTIEELWKCYDREVDAVITNELLKALMLERVWSLMKYSEDSIYIWGTGREADKLSKCISGERIAGYIETVVTKAEFHGIRVYSPEQVKEMDSYHKIVVATVFSDEIKRMSRKFQLEPERMIYLFPNENNF